MAPSDRKDHARPFLGVHFECCGVYARIYRNPGTTCYRVRCPKCLRVLVVEVAAGGTDSRFLRVR